MIGDWLVGWQIFPDLPEISAILPSNLTCPLHAPCLVLSGFALDTHFPIPQRDPITWYVGRHRATARKYREN